MFVKIIPQGHCVVVERFGRPVRVAMSGLRFFIPILEQAKNVRSIWDDMTNKRGYLIELLEQMRDTGARECFTKDNVRLSVNCAYRWRIVDPIKAIYEVDKLHMSIREAVLGEVRAYVGQNDLNFVLSSRSQISEHVISVVSDTARRWGINITGVEVQELKADDATQDAMRQQLEASRRSEAIKLEAEGRANAIIVEAEASRRAAILKAEAQNEALRLIAAGEQEYVKILSESIGAKSAAQILLAQKNLDAYQQISLNPANKVFVPIQNLSAVLTAESVSYTLDKSIS